MLSRLRLGAHVLRRKITRIDRRLLGTYLNDHAEPKLQIGGGWRCLDGWLNADIGLVPGVYQMDAARTFPFSDAQFQYLFTEHMIEHIPYENGLVMLRECHRVLRNGGVLRIVTPDLKTLMRLSEDTLSADQRAYLAFFYEAFLAQLPKTPAAVLNAQFRMWGHQFLYDAPTLEQAMAEAGFRDIVRQRTGESVWPQLRGLEHETRYPPKLLDFESLVLEGRKAIDRIYVAASARDGRFTRICVASVRYFYPDVPLSILAGGRLGPGLAQELERHWKVGIAEIPGGDYGWGFVKLEPLFFPVREKFLVLDSDTVFAGPVLDIFQDCDAPFIVDDETQSPEDLVRLYYDWNKVRLVDAAARAPTFVFNSGQWVGTSGILARDDFAHFVNWAMPRSLQHPEYFMPGDQGILNYVLNKKAFEGLSVARRKIMRWPGHSMAGLEARRVASRQAIPAIVHWAGLKRARIMDMPGGDLLQFFEGNYYGHLLFGSLRRQIATAGHMTREVRQKISARLAR